MTIADQAQLFRQVRQALQHERYDEAIAALVKAAELAHSAGDASAEGRHLGNLALIYYRVQQPEQALYYFERALQIARTEGDRLTEDGLLGNMGNILREIGRHTEATAYLNQALLIAQEIGDVRGRGIWLSNLGLTYNDLARHDEALEVHKESVNVARIMRDQRSLATRLNNLGNTYLALNQPSESTKCFHEVVAIYKSLGEPAEAAARMAAIANIYNDLGRNAATEFEAQFYYDLARDTYKDTLEMVRELGDGEAEGDLLTSLGSVYGNMGNYDEAINHFSAAYQLFQSLGAQDRLPHLENSLLLAHDLRNKHLIPDQHRLRPDHR
jgi:tetratricopeptide (TPR) repeat protein